MLEISNICAGYGNKISIKNISLRFNKGNVYAILGPNGSGKSTLLKTIDKIIKPKEGVIYIKKEDVQNLSRKKLAKNIAYLPQKNSTSASSTVFETILLGRKPYIIFEPRQEDLKLVENIIYIFGLKYFSFRNVGELSGGELQKVLIARALAQQPKILLLDEPINHLDPKNQIEILKVLKKITSELGIITIIVLHDLNLAFKFADYFIFMKQGKIYAKGDLSSIEDKIIKEVYDIRVKILNVGRSKLLVIDE